MFANYLIETIVRTLSLKFVHSKTAGGGSGEKHEQVNKLHSTASCIYTRKLPRKILVAKTT